MIGQSPMTARGTIIRPPAHHLLLFLTLTRLENRIALGSRDDLHKRKALEGSKQWLYKGKYVTVAALD